MKKTIAHILAGLLCLFPINLLLYLLGAFVEMELDPQKWESITRLIIAGANIYLLVTIIIIPLHNHNQDD